MLETSGSFQLYTIPLGWHMSRIIWGLLSSTGVWLLPIIGFVLDHLVNERSKGSAMGSKGDSTLSALEMKIFLTIMVMLLAFRPSDVTALSATTMRYTPPNTIYESTPPAEQTAGNTTPALDDVLPITSGYDIASGSIPVPPIWFLVMQLSHGFTHSLVQNLNTRGDLYRSLRRISEAATINDPETREMYADFQRQCYNPARAEYIRDNGSVDGPVDADIHWVGGENLVRDYYPNRRVIDFVPGFPFVPARDTDIVVPAGSPLPDMGRPTCEEYYNAFVSAVYDEISEDRTEGFLENGASFAELLSWIGVDTDARREQLVEWYIRGSTVEVNRTLDATMAAGENDDKAIANVAQVFSDVIQAYDGSKMAIIAELFKDSALNFVSFMQGFALMILYMVIPIIMVLGGYSLSTMASIGVAIFTLNFMPVLWALVSWVDNSVGMALYADRNTLSTALFDGSIDAVKSQAVLSLVVGALYILSGPMLIGFLSLGHGRVTSLTGAVSAIGATQPVGQQTGERAVNRVTSSVVGGARSLASGAASGAAGAAVAAAASRIHPGLAIAVAAAKAAKGVASKRES